VGFIREVSALGGKWGTEVLGGITTILAVVVYLLTKSFLIALAASVGFLALCFLRSAHRFWEQRNEAKRKIDAIEETPGFQIDAVLRNGLALRDSLTGDRYGLDEKSHRVKTMEFIAETVVVVGDYAPAYADDLQPRLFDGAGTEHFLKVVSENYRVLADVRKRL
jgi:hypothetical protein